MEVGEILTIIGQPHGTCAGRGKPYTESEWQALVERGGRFAAVLSRETVWVWTAAASE